MRNAKIRRKHAQAERLWVRFMTQPQRLIMPDYRTINLEALDENRLWQIPQATLSSHNSDLLTYVQRQTS